MTTAIETENLTKTYNPPTAVGFLSSKKHRPEVWERPWRKRGDWKRGGKSDE